METNEMKSRFGYHPCSYETFRKLKDLHKAYWQAVRDFHRWFRWDRKESQNQPEPKYCSLFLENKGWLRYTVSDDGHRRGKYFPKKLIDHGIIELYQQARMPSATPVEPFKEEILANIEKLHVDLEQYKSTGMPLFNLAS